MKIRRRAVITVHTQQVTTVWRSRQSGPGWCEACATRVAVASPEHAAARLGLNPRAVYRYLEAREIHFSETERGDLLVCLDSLIARANQ